MGLRLRFREVLVRKIYSSAGIEPVSPFVGGMHVSNRKLLDVIQCLINCLMFLSICLFIYLSIYLFFTLFLYLPGFKKKSILHSSTLSFIFIRPMPLLQFFCLYREELSKQCPHRFSPPLPRHMLNASKGGFFF